MSNTISPTISIRTAADKDATALHRLAALDSAHVPAGPVLMAEVDGTPRAAISVATGTAVADPFYASADLLDLLRLRVTLLADGGRVNARRRSLSTPIRGFHHDSLAPTR